MCLVHPLTAFRRPTLACRPPAAHLQPLKQRAAQPRPCSLLADHCGGQLHDRGRRSQG